ncbi:MAG: 3-dehydroquinate synthase [Clostridia bacterium]|nr:3-dehydroquinate synthase [Clostridia bacterium]
MSIVRVKASKEYDVVIERGGIAKLGEYLSALGIKGKVAVISDSNVMPLYGEEVSDVLTYHGYEVSTYVFDAGEESKNLIEYGRILSFLAEEGFTRRDTLLALGGGVVGDLTGFVAATYMRGVHFVNLPTSLLAAIDSSVGGKTAVDLPQGKNLVGAFYQPDLVLCDTAAFRTLPYEEIKNGLGEGVKYAVLEGGRIFEILKKGLTSDTLEEFVRLSVEAKRRIVEEDEREGGSRKFLNLGHTIAHAVEILTSFAVPHGVAVAYGVKEMTKLALERGELDPKEGEEILALLSACDLDLSLDPVEDLLPHFLADKKRSGDVITLVTIEGIGKCRLTEVKCQDLAKYFGVE